MITLGHIGNRVIPRPGIHDYEVSYLIPNSEAEKGFWDHQYQQLFSLNFLSPIEEAIETHINEDIGYFGLRSHPVDPKRAYYHIGIELDFNTPVGVTPISSGVLEYSGYGAINGFYTLISHPDVVTEDGYVLHTMYCHLKKPLLGFSSYQKMLREISLGSYPIIPVGEKDVLGITGSSGVVEDDAPKLYIQIDFRKYDETPIVIDPFRVLTGNVKKNISSLK